MVTQDDSFARELDQLHRHADSVFGGNILERARLKRINFIKNGLDSIEDQDIVITNPYQNTKRSKNRERYNSDYSELSDRERKHKRNRKSKERDNQNKSKSPGSESNKIEVYKEIQEKKKLKQKQKEQVQREIAEFYTARFEAT